MAIKNIIKAVVPITVLESLWPIYDSFLSRRLFHRDKRRYKRNYSRSLRHASQQQLDARLIFHAHSLEKGLSHEKIRYGFGKSALHELAKVMNRYIELGYDQGSMAYQNSLSVLRNYAEVHDTEKYDVKYLVDIFGDILTAAKSSTSELGGTTTVVRETKTNNRDKNFYDLFNGRYSVREYDTSPVGMAAIEAAIDVAMKTPSICNRQTSRVLIIKDKGLIESALKVQGGMTGYALPSVLLLVQTDTRHYVAISEKNQPYIDGGLFAMSLLMALEYEGLAACALNTMFNEDKDKRMRKLLKTQDYENYIMFVAVGNFKQAVAVPKSFRYKGTEVTSII